MDKRLDLCWYFEEPLDFEIKQYKLLSYLRLVEDSFLLKKLSPHLLHLEKMKKELLNFKENYNSFNKDLLRNKYIFFESNNLDGIDNKELIIVYDVIDFSLPQIESKIKMGYHILENNKQILW